MALGNVRRRRWPKLEAGQFEARNIDIYIAVRAIDANIVDANDGDIVRVVRDAHETKAEIVNEMRGKSVGLGDGHETIMHGEKDWKVEIARADRRTELRTESTGTEGQE